MFFKTRPVLKQMSEQGVVESNSGKLPCVNVVFYARKITSFMDPVETRVEIFCQKSKLQLCSTDVVI